MDKIHFVITNRDGCSIALPPTAYDVHLYQSVATLCNVSSHFGIELLGETIVSPQLFQNRAIAYIPKIALIANDLYQIWGDGFRIPLYIHYLNISKDDIAVYASLSRMFGGPRPNVHEFDWYQFIQKCAESELCAVKDLCDRFQKKFACGDTGELRVIHIHQKLTGSFDLSFLPMTVVAVMIDRNAFTRICGLDQLAGKRLVNLEIQGSPLDIDLAPLTRSSPQSVGNPLRYIRVAARQISQTLLGINGDAVPTRNPRWGKRFGMVVHKAALEWFPSSILAFMTVGHRHIAKIKGDAINQTMQEIIRGFERAGKSQQVNASHQVDPQTYRTRRGMRTTVF